MQNRIDSRIGTRGAAGRRRVFSKSMLDRGYELEQERQVNPYDHLFQSVLCGIVQYRLTGMGVEFKNANREGDPHIRL